MNPEINKPSDTQVPSPSAPNPPQTTSATPTTSAPHPPIPQTQYAPVQQRSYKAFAGILAFVVVLALSLYGIFMMPRSDNDSSNIDMYDTSKAPRNIEEINQKIAKNILFDAEIPIMDCTPSRSQYDADKEKWLDDWVACLNTSWSKNNGDKKDKSAYYYFNIEDIMTYTGDNIPDIDCKKSNYEKDHAASYCRANATIYVNTAFIGNYKNAVAALLHEFAHHISFRNGVTLDSSLYIENMYATNPKQPVSLEQANAGDRLRSELFSECAAVAIMSKNGLLSENVDTAWIESYGKQFSGAEGQMYGTTAVRTRLLTASLKNPSLASCNTWAMPDSVIK